MEELFCTVFTPAYNRGYIIENLYNSLKRQTYKNFEWVVIDDGSKDNTEELFSKWLKEDNFFKITYVKVENGGKHRAINKGLDLAKGKMFFIVDSDDYITDDAIEKIHYYENSLKNSTEKFAGVSGFRKNQNGELLGESLKEDYIDATNIERVKLKMLEDKSEVYYTEILKNNKFPEIEGENFVSENVIWNQIASQGYKIRWFNHAITVSEYIEDGLTAQGNNLFKKNPKGYLLSIKCEIKYLKPSLVKKLGYYYVYYKTVNDKYTKKEIAKDLEISEFMLNTAITLKKIKDVLKNGKK